MLKKQRCKPLEACNVNIRVGRSITYCPKCYPSHRGVRL